MFLTTLLLIIITFIIIYFIYTKIYRYFYGIRIQSQIDGKYYLVRNTKNRQESADTLAMINSRIKKLLNHLKGTDNNYQGNVNLLLSRYNENNLSENIDAIDTTYTINKGQEVVSCIATRDSNDKIYDINKLMYVQIHELSHIGCETVGHGQEFINFFRYLTIKAIECGVYKYTDYKRNPEEYCGMTLNESILD